MDTTNKLNENISYFKCFKRMTSSVQSKIKNDYNSKKYHSLIEKFRYNTLMTFVNYMFTSALELCSIEKDKLKNVNIKKEEHRKNNRSHESNFDKKFFNHK